MITLLSDFGLRDPYVAEMKAVILTICPGAKIVDITHEISKFDIRMGAFVLASAAPYFPRDTVHVAVVDPGVGTKRRPIIIESSRGLYVGPDNGLLILAAQEGMKRVYHITNEDFMLPGVSRTFHGREIFSPVGAYLSKGINPSEFGPEISDFVWPSYVKTRFSEGKVFGEVLHIDDFGNIITNISTSWLNKIEATEGGLLVVNVGEKTEVLRFCKAYGGVSVETPLAIVGSSNFLEISVNQGNAAEFFGARTGDPVQVSLAKSSS